MSADKTGVFEAMRQFGGSFASALALAWFRADPTNRARIESAWPELVTHYSAIAEAQAAQP